MITQAIGDMTSNQSVAESFSKLTRSEQVLIRKSRKNAIKAGVPICDEWLHGNGILTAVQCMYRDLGKRPTSSHKLIRKDKAKEHSASNSYWSYPGRNSTVGRPSVMLALENGNELSLVRASELSGLTEDTLNRRMKMMTLEQAMLTAKSSRTAYPKDRATKFFLKLNLDDCTSREFQDEQESHAKECGKRSSGLQRTRDYKSLTVLSNNDLMGKITYVLDLDILPDKKASLLAFLACPPDIRTGTYNVLKNVIRRCRDKDDPNYHHYGNRGIDVCESWVSGIGKLSGLHCFVLDVGPRQPMMELDRIDNDLGYSKSNCRWVTRQMNMKNQFRAEDIAARLNALVEQAVRIELASRAEITEEAAQEQVDMDDFLKSIL